jgi:hypothetical protein
LLDLQRNESLLLLTSCSSHAARSDLAKVTAGWRAESIQGAYTFDGSRFSRRVTSQSAPLYWCLRT